MENKYNSVDVKNRILSLLNARGLKPYKALPQIGLSKSTLDSSNKSMPKADTLAMIADLLDVSTDYLLGRTDTSDMTNYFIHDSNVISESISAEITVGTEKNADDTASALLKLYQQLSLRGRANVLNAALAEAEKEGLKP